MRLFGLIGKPLTHSFSKSYFTERFTRTGIADCQYENFELPSIDALHLLLRQPGLSGLNVTIPYKEQVLPFLDAVSPEVRIIGACNCIRIRNGKLEGFNTDHTGFSGSIKPLLRPHHKNALVFGTGGASKAICYALQQLGIQYQLVSRKAGAGVITYASLTNDLVAAHQLLVNTTPIGTYPDNDAALPIPYEGMGTGHLLFDVVYNPPRTAFLKAGAQRGAAVLNGERMLVLQAEESWRIWNE